MTDQPGVRILCVDGPLAGAQTTVAGAVDDVVLHDASGNEVHYRVDGLLTVFPGDLHAARVVST